MFTVADARRYAASRFARSAILKTQSRPSLILDADVLLQCLLHKPRAWLFAHDDSDISAIRTSFYKAVEKRCGGLPIAYITGEKEFWGLPFSVTPDVLIPKPDTELLVERSLAILKEKAETSRPERPLSFFDPCTGSGCVALSILHTLDAEDIQNVFCVAADISPAAISIARRNAQQLLPPTLRQRLLLCEGDMRTLPDTLNTLAQPPFSAAGLRFDLIAANPPYVPSALAHELLKDGRGEPQLALDGGADGLDFIKILTNTTRTVLNDGGILLSEVGEYHAQAARRLFENAGFSDVRIHRDLAGQDRLIEGVSI